ncbi:hypothetical protein JAAARDRAFT_193624 [Jaapia argillacea MUCL 33604]|uniref:Peptidase A1 domain-containing protein n=1 Tax=Jaapia argillacea MUCL 33604 TaxID=933084 RepID=A0A067PWE6_9AGAM|nr:hypothetical protein JAAARDRAFT_193624 [Jaapia argillacea MUCL 33604]
MALKCLKIRPRRKPREDKRATLNSNRGQHVQGFRSSHTLPCRPQRHRAPVLVDTPKVTIPFTARFRSGTGNVVSADRARIDAIKSKNYGVAPATHKRTSYSIAATNDAIAYTTPVGVGVPATNYTLLIDIGNAITSIGADKPYVKTNTSVDTGETVEVTSGLGSCFGTAYYDTLTLSPELVVKKQFICVSSSYSGFPSGIDGALGLGPTILSEGTVTGVSEVAAVTDNLYSQGTISTDAVGVFYAPTTNTSTTNGELTFGGPDATKYTGTLTYFPITTTYPASYYWGIDQSVTYNGATVLASTAGIFDTGTTLVYLASDAYNEYVSATGAKLDDTTGLLTITSAQYAALAPLNFVVSGTTYTLTANAQIWPRSLNTYIGGTSSTIYLIVNNLGTPSGEGLDFINGYTFLERFYSFFDTTNSRIGVATTSYTTATTN